MRQRVLFLGLVFSLTLNVVLLTTMSARLLIASRRESQAVRPLCERLALSPQQAQAIDSTRHCFAVESGGVCLALHRERQLLLDLLGARDPDSQAIARCLRRVDSLQSALQRRAVEAIIRERQVMTPEQAAAYLKLIRERLGEEAPCGGLEHPAAQESSNCCVPRSVCQTAGGE